ncbi:MAG: type II secretion system secretin GspD [Gammaproteobacteria bacterium]
MKSIAALLPLLLCLAAPLSALAADNAPDRGTVTASDTDEVTLNLSDAPISSLIDTVSKATGINFVVDPRVKGNVTVISSTPMNRKALYQVFLSVLDVYGYSAVPSGPVVKIIPSVNARQNTLLKGRGAEVVTRVVQVHNVPVAQIVPMLRPLIPQQGLLAAYPPNNMLIVTDRAENIRRVVRLIHDLDRPDNSEIELVKLQHASANEVARILNSLQQQAAAKGAAPGTQARVVADVRTNSVLISGDKATRKRLRALVKELDAPLPSAGDSHVVFLKYAKAKNIAKLLQGMVSSELKSEQKTKAAPKQAVNIQADEDRNALVLTGPPDKVRDLKEVVRRLDIRPAEVLIDAIIAEVSGDLARQLGAQIGVLPDSGDPKGPAAAINFTNGAASLVTLATNPAAAGPGLLLGLGDANSGNTRYGVLLNALSSNAATNILSTPSLLTLDNKEAEIVVGQNVPFVTGSYSTTTSTTGGGTVSSPFQTIERKDIGITLKVTPQINEGNSVKLKLDLTVSSLAPSVTGAADLITNKRQIKTDVITNSDSIIVLGGLIEDSYKNSTQKVPFLGDIPGLGYLFRSTSRQREKKNLMVFLHPIILNNQQAADVYTNQKYSFLRGQQLEQQLNRNNHEQGQLEQGPSLPEQLRQLSPRPTGLTPPAKQSKPQPAAKTSSNTESHDDAFVFGSG